MQVYSFDGFKSFPFFFITRLDLMRLDTGTLMYVLQYTRRAQ